LADLNDLDAGRWRRRIGHRVEDHARIRPLVTYETPTLGHLAESGRARLVDPDTVWEAVLVDPIDRLLELPRRRRLDDDCSIEQGERKTGRECEDPTEVEDLTCRAMPGERPV
jgi:hypothetical protein